MARRGDQNEAPKQFSVEPNDRVRFHVRYEASDVLVVDKPRGLVSTPGLGHESDSLLSGLFARFGHALQNLGKARDFGMLHRLDRETSGLLIVALGARAYDALRTDFEERRVRKFYLALVAGTPRTPTGVIRKPLIEAVASHPVTGKPMKLAKISSRGKASITAYRVLLSNAHASLLEARAVTGRLHQLRVHLAAIGCPILGDGIYAPAPVAATSSRLGLHAHRVVFTHPVLGTRVDVRSPMPADMARAMERVKLKPEEALASIERLLRGRGASQDSDSAGDDPADAADDESV